MWLEHARKAHPARAVAELLVGWSAYLIVINFITPPLFVSYVVVTALVVRTCIRVATPDTAFVVSLYVAAAAVSFVLSPAIHAAVFRGVLGWPHGTLFGNLALALGTTMAEVSLGLLLALYLSPPLRAATRGFLRLGLDRPEPVRVAVGIAVVGVAVFGIARAVTGSLQIKRVPSWESVLNKTVSSCGRGYPVTGCQVTADVNGVSTVTCDGGETASFNDDGTGGTNCG